MNEGGVNIFGSFVLYAQLVHFLGNWESNFQYFFIILYPLALNVYIPGVQWSVKYSSEKSWEVVIMTTHY